MTLSYQTVDVRFTEGLDTKTQPKLVIPSKWSQLNNCTLSQDGTPRRRDGSVALVPAATGYGLAQRNHELLTINAGAVSSISTGGADQSKQVSGTLGYVGVAKQEIRRSTAMQDSLDVATSAADGVNYTCYVWRELSTSATTVGINCSVIDEDTGTQLVSNVALSALGSEFCPRVTYANGNFFIFYQDGVGGTHHIYAHIIRTLTPTVVGAQTAIVSSASLAQLNFDTCAFGMDVMVAYPWNDGTTSIRVVEIERNAGTGLPVINQGPTNVFSQAQLPVATLSAMTCATYSSALAGVFVFTSGGGAFAGTAAATVDANYVVVTGPTLLVPDPPPVAGNCSITATSDGGGRLQVFTDRRSGWSTNDIQPITSIVATTTLGVFAGPNAVMRSASFAGGATDPAGPKGPWIAGKAFNLVTRVFLPVWVLENYQSLAATKASDNAQNTLFLLDCTGAAATSFAFAPVVAKALYGALGVAAINNNPPSVSTPCSVVQSGPVTWLYGCTERTLLSFVDGFNLSPSGVVEIAFTVNDTANPVSVQLGEATYIAGGSLTAYDGVGLTELGFPLYPEGINVEVVAGGGAMTAGVHEVVVVAEWVDGAGQRHQSSPSPIVSATVAANDRLRVRVPTLLVSQKAGIQFYAYVTAAAGTVFNKATSTGAGLNATANVTSSQFVTLPLIDQSDATYAGNELLYSQPNATAPVLPNDAPGPCSAVCVHQNRLVFDLADQPGQFGFSQQYVNNVGLQCSVELTGSVPLDAGPIIGFASMDEKLIIFCQRKPFVVFGSGPDDTGAGGFGAPQEVPSDVGCSEARSILKMPMGVLFKSQKGWYLLGRDLVARYVGDGVAAYDANDVRSAVLLENRQECRFASTADEQLVYDYLSDNWSTTVYRASDGVSTGTVPVAAGAYWPTLSRYVTMTVGFGLAQDTPGVYVDQPGSGTVSAGIITTARTAWMRLSIINGFQRVRWLYLTGTAAAAPTSTLSILVDFDDAYGQVAPGSYTTTFNYGTGFPVFTGTSVDVRHKLHRQKCKSVAFTFIDTPIDASPSGVEFQALSMELGLKRGTNKLPAAQSVG